MNSTEQTLLMNPRDWQKFDGPPIPGKGYIHAIRSLGNIQGKRVLEAGCGTGWLTVILAKRGAKVCAFDISAENIKIAKERARVNEVEGDVSFSVQSFYDLDYEKYFDLAVGCAILHHIEIGRVIDPLRRALKPDAKVVFYECFGNSGWLQWLRRLIPVPVSDVADRSKRHRPLKYSDLKKFSGGFGKVSWREFQLFSRLDRVVGNKSLINRLNRFDEILLHYLPILRPYARDIVLELERPLNKIAAGFEQPSTLTIRTLRRLPAICGGDSTSAFPSGF